MVELNSLTFVQGDATAYVPGDSVLVLEFWATWCPPCRQTIPHLSQLQTKYKNSVVFVGITNEDNESQIRAFVKKMGDKMNYAVGIDSQGALTNGYMGRYHITGIPHAFVVGKDGNIVWHGHPADSGMEREIAKAVAAPSTHTTTSTATSHSSYSRDELSEMTTRELKAVLSARGVDFSDCIEKADLIDRALK